MSARARQAGNTPDGARPSVARYIGEVVELDRQLRDALVLAAERHEHNYELAHGMTTLAIWSSEHLEAISASAARYGRASADRPALLRSALLGGTRIGVVGELADVTDLAALVQRTMLGWLILAQGARELRDEALLAVATQAQDDARRQLAWLTTIVQHEAPDAVSIVPDRRGQLAASVPRHLSSIAAVPDAIWGPLVAATLILVVGALGVVADSPWLVPSLGPSAVLIALTPIHPTARPWNTIVGHVGGLLAGALALTVMGAWATPTVMGDHVLVASRVFAAAIAILLTLVVGSLARASHPPAAATTLLVALGGIATLDQAVALLAGVVSLALIGELARHVRTKRAAPAERMAPPNSIASRFLHPS
jgi:hypothetical protein